MLTGSWEGSQAADQEWYGLGGGARGGGADLGADVAASPEQAVGPPDS